MRSSCETSETNSSFSRSSSRSRSFCSDEEPLHRLRLGSRCPLGLEQPAALLGELVQALVVRVQLAGHAPQDREERHVEREQREREDQREAEAGVADADVDRAVVLVELEHADRS